MKQFTVIWGGGVGGCSSTSKTMEIKFIQIKISFKEEEATVDFLKFIYLPEF